MPAGDARGTARPPKDVARDADVAGGRGGAQKIMSLQMPSSVTGSAATAASPVTSASPCGTSLSRRCATDGSGARSGIAGAEVAAG
jgi:hypothetical protein